jgi:hypothetical protein
LAKDNVAVQFVDNDRLVTVQKTNFAPRVGLAYSPRDKTVVRAGFGIFYGGLQSKATATWGRISHIRIQAELLCANLRSGQLPIACCTGHHVAGWFASGHGWRPVADIHLAAGLPLHRSGDQAAYTMTYSLGVQQQISPTCLSR